MDFVVVYITITSWILLLAAVISFFKSKVIDFYDTDLQALSIESKKALSLGDLFSCSPTING